MTVDYDGRFFRSLENSASGDVGEGTVFHYRQRDRIVWATYEGGGVAFGTLIARVLDDGSLDMRYQHVASDGALKAGVCVSTPEILPDGRIRLHEAWRWTEGGDSEGRSRIEECPPPRPHAAPAVRGPAPD